MSFIELKIPGSEIPKLQEEVDCILNYKTPSVSDGDTLQLKYTIDFPKFDNLADKLRALAKIAENDSITVAFNVDRDALAELKECLILLDCIHQKCQNELFDTLIARISIFDEKEKAA